MSRATAAVVALLLAGCGQVAQPPITVATVPDPSAAAGQARIAVSRVADGFASPVWAGAPGGDERLFVAEQHTAMIWIVRGQARSVAPFLALPAPVAQGNEQGLLGVAFHPRFADNGRFFVDYTDADGRTHVVEFHASGDRADAAPIQEWLVVDQPYANHNGGNVVFGPDGRLYVGMGDGGSGGDPENHAQDPTDLLGKILRIDVDTAGAHPEIWALGLRNPWRFSFDPATGDLWIGDVGQDGWEEIDRVPGGDARGINFGWRLREGNHPYDGAGATPERYQGPVFEYPHGADGCSVTGGVVLPGGPYLFGDYCSSRYWTIDSSGAVAWVAIDVPEPVSFGYDGRGKVLITSLAGGIWRVG